MSELAAVGKDMACKPHKVELKWKKLQLMPDFLKRGKRGSFFIFMNRTRKKFRE